MPRPRSFDEAAVLDRAVELFWEKGYEGTSLADLEQELGIGRQSLYNTFGDKHQLYQKALERYRAWGAEQQLGVLLGADAGLDAIRTFFDELLDHLAPHGTAPRRSCFIANAALELGAQCAETRGRCNGARQATERALRHALANALREGEVRRSLDVPATAAMLMTQAYGLSVMAKMGSTRDTMRTAVEAMLSGLA